MKFGTRAIRIGQKANCPVLTQVLLKKKVFSDLPSECLLWTGSTNQSGKQLRIRRNQDNIPYMTRVDQKPYGIIKIGKQQVYVARWVLQAILEPDYRYRMKNDCGNTLCINPRHWTAQRIKEEKISEPPSMSLDVWTEEDILEILEIYLTTNQPKCWEDLVGAPFLEGAPHDQLRAGLCTLNKEHLI